MAISPLLSVVLVFSCPCFQLSLFSVVLCFQLSLFSVVLCFQLSLFSVVLCFQLSLFSDVLCFRLSLFSVVLCFQLSLFSVVLCFQLSLFSDVLCFRLSLFSVSSARSRWHRSARKGTYALHPASQLSPQGFPGNRTNVDLAEHTSSPACHGEWKVSRSLSSR